MVQLSKVGGIGRLGGGGGAAAIPYSDAFTQDISTQGWYNATTPNSIYVSALDKTIIAWEAWNGRKREVRVKAYDWATQTWGITYYVSDDTLTDDDHGVPGIVQDDDGYFWIAGFAHAGNLKVFRSTNPNDISAWTSTTTITGSYTYPHFNNVGGKLHLFLRDDTDSYDRPLVMYAATPSAGVISWGSPTTIGDFGADTRWYQGTNLIDGTDIIMSATKANADDTIRQNVYFLVYHTTDGSVSNIAGTTTVAAGSLPLDLTTLNADFRIINTGASPATTNIPQACFDDSGNIHLAYMLGEPVSGPLELYHTMWNGSAWSTAAKVSDFPTGNSRHRTDTYTVAPRASDSVAVYGITASDPAFDNGGDVSMRLRASDGTWGDLTVVKAVTSDNALDYVSMVRDGPVGANAIFGYRSDLATNNNGALQGFMHGSVGFLRTPFGPWVHNICAQFSTQPSNYIKSLMQDFIDGMIAAGIWQTSVSCYVPFAPDAASALINWRSPRFNLSAVGTPVFAGAYAGYTISDSNYFSVGFATGAMTATNCSVSAVFHPGGSSNSVIGTNTISDLTLAANPGGNAAVRIGSSNSAAIAGATNNVSMVSASRTGTTLSVFLNGAEPASLTATNVALSGQTIWYGRRTTTYAQGQQFYFRLGTYRSDATMQDEYTLVKAFINGVAPGTMP